MGFSLIVPLNELDFRSLVSSLWSNPVDTYLILVTTNADQCSPSCIGRSLSGYSGCYGMVPRHLPQDWGTHSPSQWEHWWPTAFNWISPQESSMTRGSGLFQGYTPPWRRGSNSMTDWLFLLHCGTSLKDHTYSRNFHGTDWGLCSKCIRGQLLPLPSPVALPPSQVLLLRSLPNKPSACKSPFSICL